MKKIIIAMLMTLICSISSATEMRVSISADERRVYEAHAEEIRKKTTYATQEEVFRLRDKYMVLYKQRTYNYHFLDRCN